MPSASAKLEKQASTEALEPIKQGITIIEHKIRNLEKRKARLETLKNLQSSGKELNSDQLQAISKYDEVLQTLEFARDLCKQFNGIASETAKQQKKQARKEALERTQHDLSKVKEILIVQDVLANMGQDNVREDFLAGRNGACKLKEEDLQHLDDLFTEVSPKRDAEEGVPPFAEQLQKAAEHLLSLAEGKNKEVVGTTYAQLKKQIEDIGSCGYFDASSTSDPSEAVIVDGAAAETPAVAAAPAEEEEEFEPEEEEPESVPSTTFQSSKVMQPVEGVEQKIMPGVAPVVACPVPVPNNIILAPQQPANEVISNVISSVTNSSFHFLQDSELDTPDVTSQTPTAPPPSALPIPSQTFTNQSFVPAPQSYTQQPQPQPQPAYNTIPIPSQQPSYGAVAFTPAPQNTFTHQQHPHVMLDERKVTQQPEVTDWNESTEVSGRVMESDWNLQCESDAWQQQSSQQQPTTDSWSTQNDLQNDGFVPAGGRGGGRGGRGGRGPRGGSGGYGSRGRTGGGGGSFYRNNSDNTYYQSNGYQNRGDGNYSKRGGSGSRGGGSRPNQDRGGPRGGGRGGERGRGGSNRQ